MLTNRQISEVEQMHAEGLSQRQIERRTGIGRGHVARILSGRAQARDPLDIETIKERTVLPVAKRCPGGHLVTLWPCLECEIMGRADRGRVAYEAS